MKPNRNQEKAISHLDGPMMVLAGPGSGKTATITQRVKYLIEEYNIEPSNILTITFTKAAATEMKDRFMKLTNNQYPRASFMTFHSLFFKLLKLAYNYTAQNIIKNKEQYIIIKTLLEKENIDIDNINETINNIISEISNFKTSLLPIYDYKSNLPNIDFIKIFTEYNEITNNKNLIDFDDMIIKCQKLLKENDRLLSICRNQYKYIQIDEFQDINPLQYDIIKMISNPLNNLFIVGDDDQSIYKFRGSSPQIMLNFTKEFDNAKVCNLDINYRSSQKIVSVATRLISNNKNRYPKNLNAYNKDKADNIKIIKINNTLAQNKFIVNKIIEFMNEGEYSYSDFAILYRNNIDASNLSSLLISYNLPFKSKEIIPNLFNHFLSIQILSYLRAGNTYNKKAYIDRTDFLKIMNIPLRYISRAALNSTTVDINYLLKFYSNKPYMIEKLLKLRSDIETIGRLKPASALSYIRLAVGFNKYLSDYCKDNHLDIEGYNDILQELEDFFSEYENLDTLFEAINDYEDKIYENKKEVPDNNSITLSTFHSSKGLEFKIVFIINTFEGAIPHKKATTIEDIEEERRLFYVAITRAKNLLFIIIPKEKSNKELKISRFIKEIIK